MFEEGVGGGDVYVGGWQEVEGDEVLTFKFLL